MAQKKRAQIDENILTVVGEIHMPLMDLPRRVPVVRLADGRLVVFSAIALDAEAMVALKADRRPAFLIVPSDTHRLDVNTWKGRDPEIEHTLALRTQLLQWSQINTLVRILVSHGSPITDNPRQVPRELVESLT